MLAARYAHVEIVPLSACETGWSLVIVHGSARAPSSMTDKISSWMSIAGSAEGGPSGQGGQGAKSFAWPPTARYPRLRWIFGEGMHGSGWGVGVPRGRVVRGGCVSSHSARRARSVAERQPFSCSCFVALESLWRYELSPVDGFLFFFLFL